MSQIQKLATSGGGSSSPLTTKGDVWGYDTADTRIPIGADNTVLTADSTQTLGVKWAAPSGGGGNPIPLFDNDGVYLNGPIFADTNIVQNKTVVDQRLYLTCQFVSQDCTLDNLLCVVGVAVAGATFRMGIYDSVGGIPTNLVVESAEISSATTGIKESSSLSTALSAGWYWVGMSSNNNAGAPQFNGFGSTYKNPNFVVVNGSALSVRNSFIQDTVDPASSLPSTLSVSSALNSNLPIVWLKLSL